MMIEKKDMPLVSVVMPCYNHEKYVAASIESVLNQTYQNIEFIVLDNGSTDSSYDIIKRYEDKLTKVLHFDKNDIAKAGEVLRRSCTGKYLAFMTSDDIWLPQKIEKQMEVFRKNKDVKACFTWANFIDDDSNIISGGENNIFGERNRTRGEWVERLFLGGNCMAYPSTIVEIDTYYEILNQMKPFYQLPDEYMWLLCLLKNNIYLIEESLVNYRWHTSGSNCNMSTPNKAVGVRTSNEKVLISEFIMEQMPADLFVEVFGKHMQNPNANTPDEILCEKFFVLMGLAETTACIGQAVINFYYRNNKYIPGVGDSFTILLQDKYNYTYLDFQEYCANHGIGEMHYKQAYYQKVEERCRKQEMILSALYGTLDSDLSKEERKNMYRSILYANLDNDIKELVTIIVNCIGNMVLWIGESSDNEIQQNIPMLIESAREISKSMHRIWDEFLCLDPDMDEAEWENGWMVLEQENVETEEFCDEVISLFVKTYIVLQQYAK